MTADEIAALFAGTDGRFLCARWGRPIVPVVFGVAPDSLPLIKGAIEAVVALAGHKMAETDPELGANLMMFFVADWQELREAPNLDRLVADLSGVVDRLQREGARHYQMFRFDPDGAIRAAFVFVRLQDVVMGAQAEALALAQAVQVMLTWGAGAFATRAALHAVGQGEVAVRPEIAQLMRAAYDPVLPPVAHEPHFALRLAARMAVGGVKPQDQD